jgi:hypothetical protein
MMTVTVRRVAFATMRRHRMTTTVLLVTTSEAR